jgi:outer membrane protein OmpA-like peptidoglycan-associated protein
MKSITLSALAMLFVATVFAQGNLVQNPSFEDPTKKIKEEGSIDLAFPWESATEKKADLFNPKSKGEDWGVPNNKYGDAEPKSGEGYAGVLIHSYKESEPRSYLQMKLTAGLEEEKVYCVKMSVMLAMLSKYASNNIGMYLSDKPVNPEALAEGAITPQVIHSQNKIFDEMFDWTDICQTYIAQGGEKYLTIGNFSGPDETEEEKMKKPKGVIGQQARGAYYYIDDVSVMNMAGVDECDCEKDASGKSLQVKYSKEVSSDLEVDVSEDIEMTRIYFEETSSEISENAMKDIQKVAALLEEHPSYKVKITGHTDPVEEVKVTGDVSLQRAEKVRDALIENGAYEKKLLVVGVQDFDPATEDASSAGQAQNRRVQFEVVSTE